LSEKYEGLSHVPEKISRKREFIASVGLSRNLKINYCRSRVSYESEVSAGSDGAPQDTRLAYRARCAPKHKIDFVRNSDYVTIQYNAIPYNTI